MSPTEFRAWKAVMGLSWSEVADALGLTRRAALALGSGENRVRPAVAKLCERLAREARSGS